MKNDNPETNLNTSSANSTDEPRRQSAPLNPPDSSNPSSTSSTSNQTLNDFVSPQPFPHQPTPDIQRTHPVDRYNGSAHQNRLTAEQEQDLIRYNHLSYILNLLIVTSFLSLIMNYYLRNKAQGTWLATHFDWQIKTSWYSAIMFVTSIFLLLFAIGGLGVSLFAESGKVAIGSVLLWILSGFIFLSFVCLHLYRVAKGWIALSENRPI